MQIVYGCVLLCTNGLPIVIEVIEGNTTDPTTLKSQVEKLKSSFGIKRGVLVGDRGGKDQRGSQILRFGLDYLPACAADSSTDPRGWAPAALFVR
jgi:hypothetical protein